MELAQSVVETSVISAEPDGGVGARVDADGSKRHSEWIPDGQREVRSLLVVAWSEQRVKSRLSPVAHASSVTADPAGSLTAFAAKGDEERFH